MLAVHPLLLAQISVLGAGGALGIPGSLRLTCCWGACCAAMRADLTGPFPGTVPFVSVHSHADRIVDWRSTLDPAARHREVDASHGGLTWDPASLAVIADELGSLAGSRPGIRIPARDRSADHQNPETEAVRPGRRRQ